MILRTIFTILAWLLLAAHFSRADNNILAIVSLLVPLLLLVKKPWAYLALLGLTIGGAIVWIVTTIQIARVRIEAGDDWARMAIILGTVALFTLVTALLLLSKKTRKRFGYSEN